MNTLISIIIPTYNRAHLIGETLNSILMQTYTNWECIIIDDGSTDDTADIIKKYTDKDARFQYHQRPLERIKGPNSCRNYGFELSTGYFIKWFDSDDIMYPYLLEKQLDSLKKNEDMSVCQLEYFNFEENISNKYNIIYSKNLIEDYLIGKISFFTFIPTWKRSFLNKQKELFDETITNLDDWDFNLRMLYAKPSIVYINEPLIQYRIHENSLSKEINKLNFEEIKSEFRAREKHILLLKNNKIVDCKILQKFIVKRYKSILRDALLINHPKKGYFFKMLLGYQIRLFDFVSAIKTFSGFLSYSIFKKGYTLLK